MNMLPAVVSGTNDTPDLIALLYLHRVLASRHRCSVSAIVLISAPYHPSPSSMCILHPQLLLDLCSVDDRRPIESAVVDCKAFWSIPLREAGYRQSSDIRPHV